MAHTYYLLWLQVCCRLMRVSPSLSTLVTSALPTFTFSCVTLSLQAAIFPHRYLLWLQVNCRLSLSLRRASLPFPLLATRATVESVSFFKSCKPSTDSLTTTPSTTGDLRKAMPA